VQLNDKNQKDTKAKINDEKKFYNKEKE